MIAATSAEVTQIPERILLTIGTVGFVIAMFALMRKGWLRKISSQSEIMQPLGVPADFVADVSFTGRYIASTQAGSWLSRIAVHGLGVPARCIIESSHAGLVLKRDSADAFFIPRRDLISIRADRAIAGKAFEKDGIAVLTWKLGDTFIDSGFRADTTQQHIDFLSLDVLQESAK